MIKKIIQITILHVFIFSSNALSSPHVNSPAYDIRQYHKYVDILGNINTDGSSQSNDQLNIKNLFYGLYANVYSGFKVKSSINTINTNIGLVYPTLLSGETGADQFTGFSTTLIGGYPIPDIPGQFALSGGLGAPGKLSIYGSTDGPFNNGCVLFTAMTNNGWGYMRAPASGADYHNGAGAVTLFSDGITHCNWTGNIPPLMGLEVDHYDAQHVYLKNKLTAEQIALIHPNQYIATNSLYIPTSPKYSAVVEKPADNTTYQEGYYKGVVQEVDPNGMYIMVNAWAAPASGDISSEQIPTTTSLDTVFTSYAKPMVFVGAITGASSYNDYLEFDDRKTSLVRSEEYDELDFRYYAKNKYEVPTVGFTFSDAAYDGSPVMGMDAYTTDSALFAVNSDRPTILRVAMDSRATLIDAPSFYLPGNQGVSSYDKRLVTDMFGFNAFADSVDGFNFLGYLKKESSANGASATSFHLGLKINGDIKTPEASDGGAWGQIAWNVNGTNNGGISLCGGAGSHNCGVNVDYENYTTIDNGLTINGRTTSHGSFFVSGDAATKGKLTVGGDIESNSITSSGNITVGNSSILSLSYPRGGSPYISASSPSEITFGSNAASGNLSGIVANNYRENLFTPASSNSSCTAGQFADDANYHYVCVANNTWKRAPLSSW